LVIAWKIGKLNFQRIKATSGEYISLGEIEETAVKPVSFSLFISASNLKSV
jgi:hypothetical protein